MIKAKAVLIISLLLCSVYLQTTSGTQIRRPIPAAISHISAIGWPFVFRTALVNENPNGGLRYWNHSWSRSHFLIDSIVTLLLLLTSYFALIYCILPRFPQFGLGDIFSMIAAISVVLAAAQINYDLFFFDHFPVIDDATMELTAKQRPLTQQVISGSIQSLALYGIIRALTPADNQAVNRSRRQRVF